MAIWAFFKCFIKVVQTTAYIAIIIKAGIADNTRISIGVLNKPNIKLNATEKILNPKKIFVHLIRSKVILKSLKQKIAEITNPIINNRRLIIFTNGTEYNEGVINVFIFKASTIRPTTPKATPRADITNMIQTYTDFFFSINLFYSYRECISLNATIDY